MCKALDGAPATKSICMMRGSEAGDSRGTNVEGIRCAGLAIGRGVGFEKGIVELSVVRHQRCCAIDGAQTAVSVALDEFDPDAVNPLDEREPHRYTARKRERPRFGRHFNVLRLERRDGVVDV